LGYLDDETENEFITRELEAGIKSFQKDNGLRIDGILMPRGETEREIEDQGVLEKHPYNKPWYPVKKSPPLPDGIMSTAVGQNDKQQEKETTRISQEQQIENGDTVLASYGTVSQNADATGKERRGEVNPPAPKSRPLASPPRPPILKGIENQTVIKDIEREEGKPEINNFMFKDTVENGGKVTVAGGILLNTVGDAKELPFTVPDVQGGRRRATDAEIEQAYKKVVALKQPDEGKKYTAGKYNPTKNTEDDLDDLQLPDDIATREFNERIRASASELRDKFTGFDGLPKNAQAALLDMEFNLGRNFNGKKWPKLFGAVGRKDWEGAAQESHRVEDGHAGMRGRNERTRERFLRALKE
jgi:hypothetical protein